MQLYVATADGYFYEYSLNVRAGGECKLERVRLRRSLSPWYDSDVVSVSFLPSVDVKENVLRDSESEEIGAVYIS